MEKEIKRNPLSCWKCDLIMRKTQPIMKNSIHKNSQLPFPAIPSETGKRRMNFNRKTTNVIRNLALALLVWLPMVVQAALTLPPIPSNSSLARKFELSTEMVYRVKVGETYLPSGALIAYINGEIRGAQTASVNFPATGINVYKLLVFNDKTGDEISFKYYDIFSEKIYDITEKIEFVPNLVPDYANPTILTAYCKPIEKVTGLIPEDGKTNQNATLDLFWQPSPNTSYYTLFVWEDGQPTPATPTYTNIYATTRRLYNLKYGQLYRWKVGSVNDCSSVESTEQTFRVRQLPDLTVTSVAAPASFESGSNFNLTFTVKNIGVGNTAGTSWNDLVYASTDATLSNDDRLLSNTANLRQLEPDSSYTRVVTVSLPIDVSGNFYFIVKTDQSNSVSELLETNNEGKTTSTSTVTLKTLPDILVKDIQSAVTSVNPGDSITINWKVENIGGTTATGGWAERITIVPVSGLKITISPNTEYRLPLNSGTIINQSRKIKIPDLPKFSGDANIEIELFPFPELQEYAANKANNKAQSANVITLADVLTLEIQASSVLEGTPLPVRCIVTRSGDIASALDVNLAASVSGQVTIPVLVTIPANQSSIVFNLTTVNNAVLEGPRNVDITASAASYANSVKTITILDDEIPKLTATLSNPMPTEGEIIEMTVSRDLVTDQALNVSISTNKPNQWSFPSSMVIPANEASAKVSVVVTDDKLPELKSDATIFVSSVGVTPGQVTGSITDNDLPQVTFEILSDTVSESAGVYATWGVITRVKGDENITVNLTQSPAGALFFPTPITLAKGVGSQKFNIGVVDNGDVDGYRKSIITGSIFVSSCNCGTTPDNGGVVTAELVIADNDGPALSVSVNPLSLPEGKTNAGNLTISRNTPTTDALDVIISHNDNTEVSIPTAATIPAGQKSVIVPISTLNDDTEDGNQMVLIQASATSFTTGFGYVFVTDLNKPDLEITDLVVDKTSAATNEMIEITGTAYNVGFATAPSGVKITFYSSKDNKLDDKDQLLGEFTFPAPIPKETTANFLQTVEVPDVTGNYFIIGKINPNEQITELAYYNNESEPVLLEIVPEYTATAQTDEVLYLPNTTIPIHGIAKNRLDVPMPNVDVDVYVITNGLRRVFKAKTNASGEFTADFVPNPNESGHYIIGACFPAQNLDTQQDAFDIPGLTRTSTGHIIWEMKLGQTLTGKIGIKNTSEATLNKVVINADKLPAGCELKFDTIASMGGNQTKEFSFILKANELTIGKDYEQINFTVSSLEGATTSFPAYYYCQALQAQLKIDPASLNTTMTKGKTRIYELYLYNNGAGESGAVTISLPNVEWMTLLSPSTIANMGAQDTAKVILGLTPTTDTPLNTPISGSIAINCVNGSGVQLPYRIEAVSEETGTLRVDVIDEYTYYTEGKPHVKNAHVVVRHPFSGKIMADGFTDENGIFEVPNLPEGAYKMNVEAEKHEGFQTTVIIDPGRVNEQTVFLSFQAITYTWEVVPTEIEDHYEVQLVMKFETNVPAPVVIMEMPTEMPQLFNDETFPFMITLTNKGLITAKDVEVNLPQNDPEYVFLTNFTKMDLLAQQAIQVPVVMKRKDALKSANTTSEMDATQSSGPCTDYAFTIYGFECGKDKKWHSTSHGITFTGRICPGTGVPGGWGGWGPGWSSGPSRGGTGPGIYDPFNYTPVVAAPTIGCDNCLIDLSLALLACLPGVGAAFNTISCLKTLAGYSGVTPEFVLDVGICLGGYIPGYGCPIGLFGALKSCIKDPPILVKSASIIEQLKASNSMSPIIQQALDDMAYFVYKQDAQVGWMTEVMGGMDWQSKGSFMDFLTQLDSIAEPNIPVNTEKAIQLKQKMMGSDITESEIDAFLVRWNNTINAYKLGIYSPTDEYPNIISNVKIEDYVQKADSADRYAFSKGYTSVGEMYNASLTTLQEQVNENKSSVCVSVTINITQKVVMTREAFKGTLTIFNGHNSEPMKEVKLNLEIKDENGVLSNDLFHIETSALDILTGIDGTGVLDAQKKGSATVLFIPEKGAAPTVPKSYSFGGSFSYLDPFTGVTVTKPLFPVTLDVNPSPDLYLHYFMQRDILGDDALTEPVEPIVPAELAVMVQNNGYGTAKNVRIESAQPKIVENEKGLAVNFALIGSNLNGQPRQLGLTNIDFGNIAPKTSTIGQWWFTSDLLGHFISYETKLTHLDSRGNPELSLISGVSLHELIKSVRVYSGVEDGINDFLVNEVQDSKETPDIIYLSNSGTLDVYPAVSHSTSGNIASGNHELELIVTPKQPGWNYHKFVDPGNGNYKIVSVTRVADGQIIPLDNVWQTHVTLPDGKEPVYENMIHFLDVFADFSAQTYIIKFSAPAQNPPAIVNFQNVPTVFVTDPVTSINVVFNKPIDAATFNYEDMTLRVQGGPDLMDNTVTVTAIDQVTYKVDLTTKSTLDGYYVLNVQTTGIKDLIGTSGVEGKQANWTQFIGVPAISEFIGLPDNNLGAPFDNMLIRFNVPIDKTSLAPQGFFWLRNGTPVTDLLISITEMDTEGKLFQIAGLQNLMTQDGEYSLTVDLTKIKSLDGVFGILPQSIEWEIDQTAPSVSEIIPTTAGGYDSQHRTGFTVKFSEPVNGFGVSSLELWKDGLRQPLSQLDFKKILDTEYLFTQFRMLTYYEGNYQLWVKMKDLTDNAGNSRTDTVKYNWIVYRTPPKAITDLRITPDRGFSNTDNVTDTRHVTAMMTVNEPNTRIQLYQTDNVDPILLADTLNVGAGPLSLPISFTYTGNLILEAHCIDMYTNNSITKINVTIDEAALVGSWKNVPAAVVAQPASLELEFTDKLLDETKLKDFLKFERNGQSIGTHDLVVTKSTDKLFVLSGMNTAGNASGTYAVTMDVTKLNKYSSGRQGIAAPKAQYSLQSPNRAPNANAGANQTVDENTLVNLDGSASNDPDSDAITYLWEAPSGITLSSTSDAKPTFTAPEVTSDQTFTFTLTVNDGQVSSSVSQVIITVKDITVLSIQSVNLSAGWNIISANVIPPDLDMEAIFQTLISNGKLKKVMDEAGNALEDFGVFGGWTNKIGDLKSDRGYKVNVKETASLVMQGLPVSLPMDISLKAGWNIIAFPSDKEVDAMSIFQPLIDAGKLKKVMDESGLAIENFGVFGGWTNKIGNLKPNNGYKVNVMTDATLTIPANSPKLAVIPSEVLASSHFRNIFTGNGTDHMNINLVELAKGGFKAGDEIGIFDGNRCVGSAMIGPDQLLEDQISIAASGNDELDTEPNGFIQGNAVTIKLFRNNQEYLLTPELLNNSMNIFTKNESMFARVNTQLATIQSHLPEISSINCYPNPFSDQLTIEIDLTGTNHIEVKIFDVSGRLIRDLFRGSAINSKTIVWNGRSDQGTRVAPGNYYVKVNNVVKKVVLKH